MARVGDEGRIERMEPAARRAVGGGRRKLHESRASADRRRKAAGANNEHSHERTGEDGVVMKIASGLALGASLAALAAIQPARAQPGDQATASSASGLEEVVVTARRREEKAQTVPIVINTFNQKVLQQQDVKTIDSFAKLVPGLSFCCGHGRANYVWLRGVPGVVAYFAEAPLGVYIGPATSGGLSGSASFFDMENIQALKGPQGTLFGLNADGGALLFQPKRPGNDLEGYGQVTLGDYNRHTIEGATSIPIVKDKLLLRIGGEYHHNDGFVHDLTQNKDVNDEDFWVARGSMIFRPTDDFENYLVANYFYSRTRNDVDVLLAVNPAGPAAKIYGARLSSYLAQQQALGFYTIVGSGVPAGTAYKQEQLNIVDIARWDIDDNLSLKNIAGYSEYRFLNRQDLDGTPLTIGDPGTGIDGDTLGPIAQYSDELQLNGKSLSGNLNWVVGTFLSFYHIPDVAKLYNVYFVKSGTQNFASGRTQALYAQGTYDFSRFVEGLSLTLGYRYTWDWRSAAQNNLNANGTISGGFAADASFKAPGYTGSLAYQLSPQTMAYVTYSKGYSSGGFNITAPPQFRQYQPEYLTNVEVGVKSDWELFGVKARTNADYFHGWYSNIQVAIAQTVTNPNGTKALTTVIQNAAKADMDGWELEATVLPLPGVEISGNFLYMEARYSQFMSNGVNQTNVPFLFLPRMKYSLNGRYHLPIDESWGDLSFAASYTWQQHLLAGFDPTPVAMTPSFGTLNLNLDWDNIAGRPIDASLFVTNLLENHWTLGQAGAYAANSLGIYSVAVADPRQFGFRLRLRFGPGLDLGL